MIRVVVVDDEQLVRSGFAAILRSDPSIEVVGEATDGVEAISVVTRLQPDVVVMDVRMPNLDGVRATQAIKANPTLADTRVLILSTFDLDEYVFESLRVGASGFLLKDTPPSEFLAAVHTVALGESVLTPALTRRLIENFVVTSARHTTTMPGWVATLTSREREVLEAVGRGLSNGEIAQELFMSPATAKTHVSRLLAKLDARDRSQLVIGAYEAGIVSSA